MYLLIYLVGFLAAYFIVKKWIRPKGDNDWNGIFTNFIIALFSWAAILGIILSTVITWLIHYTKDKKPPRWL